MAPVPMPLAPAVIVIQLAWLAACHSQSGRGAWTRRVPVPPLAGTAAAVGESVTVQTALGPLIVVGSLALLLLVMISSGVATLAVLIMLPAAVTWTVSVSVLIVPGASVVELLLQVTTWPVAAQFQPVP